MATTFGDVAASAHGRSAEYEQGWADATRAATNLVQRAVDEWLRINLVAEAAGLTQLRDAIGRQRPE